MYPYTSWDTRRRHPDTPHPLGSTTVHTSSSRSAGNVSPRVPVGPYVRDVSTRVCRVHEGVWMAFTS